MSTDLWCESARLDNVVAGRAVCGDHAVYPRVPPCFAMGEAAGTCRHGAAGRSPRALECELKPTRPAPVGEPERYSTSDAESISSGLRSPSAESREASPAGFGAI